MATQVRARFVAVRAALGGRPRHPAERRTASRTAAARHPSPREADEPCARCVPPATATAHCPWPRFIQVDRWRAATEITRHPAFIGRGDPRTEQRVQGGSSDAPPLFLRLTSLPLHLDVDCFRAPFALHRGEADPLPLPQRDRIGHI
jgi:hypothetical protein